MNVFYKIASVLEHIVSDVIPIIREACIQEQEYIAQLNREQLLAGIKGDGSDMPSYVANSKQPGAPGKIKLFEKGDFHGGIAPLFEDEEGFEIIGTDEKTDILVSKYGNILDLTEENRLKLGKRIVPVIEEIIRSKYLTKIRV